MSWLSGLLSGATGSESGKAENIDDPTDVAASVTNTAAVAAATVVDDPYTATPDSFGNMVINFNVNVEPTEVMIRDIWNKYHDEYQAIIFEQCVLPGPQSPYVHDPTSAFEAYNIGVKAQIEIATDPDDRAPHEAVAKEYFQRKAKHMRDGVWLIRNGSNCPDLHDGKVYAAGTIVLVKYNGQTYYIGVKDKSKGVIAAPGGCADENEVDDHKATAIRETREETKGMHDGKPVTGLEVPPQLASRFFSVDIFSSYFGILNIPDMYTTYVTVCGYDDSGSLGESHLFTHLFGVDPDESGIYSLALEDNDEIEYVHAFPIDTSIPCNEATLTDERSLTEFCNVLKAGPLAKPIAVYSGRERKPIVSSLFGVNAYLAYAAKCAKAPMPAKVLTNTNELKKFQPRMTIRRIGYNFE